MLCTCKALPAKELSHTFVTIWLISSGSEVDLSQGLLAMSAYEAMHVPWLVLIGESFRNHSLQKWTYSIC